MGAVIPKPIRRSSLRLALGKRYYILKRWAFWLFGGLRFARVGAWISDAPPLFIYEVYEREHIMQPGYWGGYTRHNLLRRKKYDMEGNLLDDEYVVENHAIMMYSPFIEEKSASNA